MQFTTHSNRSNSRSADFFDNRAVEIGLPLWNDSHFTHTAESASFETCALSSEAWNLGLHVTRSQGQASFVQECCCIAHGTWRPILLRIRANTLAFVNCCNISSSGSLSLHDEFQHGCIGHSMRMSSGLSGKKGFNFQATWIRTWLYTGSFVGTFFDRCHPVRISNWVVFLAPCWQLIYICICIVRPLYEVVPGMHSWYVLEYYR